MLYAGKAKEAKFTKATAKVNSKSYVHTSPGYLTEYDGPNEMGKQLSPKKRLTIIRILLTKILSSVSTQLGRRWNIFYGMDNPSVIWLKRNRIPNGRILWKLFKQFH